GAPTVFAAEYRDATRPGEGGTNAPHVLLARTNQPGTADDGSPTVTDQLVRMYADGAREDDARATTRTDFGGQTVTVHNERRGASGLPETSRTATRGNQRRVAQGLPDLQLSQVVDQRFDAKGQPASRFTATGSWDDRTSSIEERTDTFAGGKLADTKIHQVDQTRDFDAASVDQFSRAMDDTFRQLDAGVDARHADGKLDVNTDNTRIRTPPVGSSRTVSDTDIDYDAGGGAVAMHTVTDSTTVDPLRNVVVDKDGKPVLGPDQQPLTEPDANGVQVNHAHKTTQWGAPGGTAHILDANGRPTVDGQVVNDVEIRSFDPDKGWEESGLGDTRGGHQYRQLTKQRIAGTVKAGQSELSDVRRSPLDQATFMEGHDDDWLFDHKQLRLDDTGQPTDTALKAGETYPDPVTGAPVKVDAGPRHDESLDGADKFQRWMDEHQKLTLVAGAVMAVGGIVAAPFSGGASLALTVAGVGLATADAANIYLKRSQGTASWGDVAIAGAGVALAAIPGAKSFGSGAAAVRGASELTAKGIGNLSERELASLAAHNATATARLGNGTAGVLARSPGLTRVASLGNKLPDAIIEGRYANRALIGGNLGLGVASAPNVVRSLTDGDVTGWDVFGAVVAAGNVGAPFAGAHVARRYGANGAPAVERPRNATEVETPTLERTPREATSDDFELAGVTGAHARPDAGRGPAPLDGVIASARETPGTITVRRSNGDVEPGWVVRRSEDGTEQAFRTRDDGRVMSRPVERDADFFRLNPEQLTGTNVRLVGAKGELEGGWVVTGRGATADKVAVSQAGRGAREISVDEAVFGAQPTRDAATGALVGAARRQSLEFNQKHALDGTEPIADGYVDGGRSMGLGDDGTIGTASRERIVVDRARDAKLRGHLDVARNLRNLPEAERAQAIGRYVDEVMGGQDPNREAINIAASKRHADQDVLLGDIPGTLDGTGVCRHRALLFKLMADEAGLKTTLRRGRLQGGAHAWNDVQVDGQRVIVDVMNPWKLAADGGHDFIEPASSPIAGIYRTMDGDRAYAPSAGYRLSAGQGSVDQVAQAIDGAQRSVDGEVFIANGRVAASLAQAADRQVRVGLNVDPERYAGRGAEVAKHPGIEAGLYRDGSIDSVVQNARYKDPDQRSPQEKAALVAAGEDPEGTGMRYKNHAKVVVVDGTRALVSTAAFGDRSRNVVDFTFDVRDPAAVAALQRWSQATRSGTTQELRAAGDALQQHDIYVNDPLAGQGQRALTQRLVETIDAVPAGETIHIGSKVYDGNDPKAKKSTVLKAIRRAEKRGVTVDALDERTAQQAGLHGTAVVTHDTAYVGTAHLSRKATDGTANGRQSREIGVFTQDPDHVASVRSTLLGLRTEVETAPQRAQEAVQAADARIAREPAGSPHRGALVQFQDELARQPIATLRRVEATRAQVAEVARALAADPTLAARARITGPELQSLEMAQASVADPALARLWEPVVASAALRVSAASGSGATR
ncbi:MAG: hypothetical protein JWM98_1425, partial [Thermoleophilia bacterium]|nr:hypothetical protein [Thermoleophilia bacterium]